MMYNCDIILLLNFSGMLAYEYGAQPAPIYGN